MKLRIRGDSLRLRLSQGDVARLAEHGHVEESTHFAPGEGGRLDCLLAADPHAVALVAELEPRRIRVRMPIDLARLLTDTEEVGVRGEQDAGEGRSLRIVIEKDFECLAPRVGEPESDGFPNPRAEC
ncbi:MAG TPA: hypothetical protein VFG69_04525 [Nannocystaceae bacterium]|nr:hypothetical protein [Nannocystaceae bacterium]